MDNQYKVASRAGNMSDAKNEFKLQRNLIIVDREYAREIGESQELQRALEIVQNWLDAILQAIDNSGKAAE